MEVSNFQAVPGRGVRGMIDGKIYFLGTRLLLQEQNIPIKMEEGILALESEGKTVMLLSDEIAFL